MRNISNVWLNGLGGRIELIKTTENCGAVCLQGYMHNYFLYTCKRDTETE
jgi:hypothetical protein